MAKWAVNILVLASEIRVVTTMLALSGSWLTAILSMAGTGLMFILWYDVLETHPLANRFQKLIDGFFTVWALVMGAVFVFADFATKVHINGVGISIDFLIKLLAVSTAGNIIGLIVWLALDSDIRAKRARSIALAEEKYKLAVLQDKATQLAHAEETLKLHSQLRDKYGEDALEALGVELPTLKHAPKAVERKSGAPSPKAKTSGSNGSAPDMSAEKVPTEKSEASI